MDSKPNRRSVISAVLIASFVMLVSGMTYRTLAARLTMPLTATPIVSDALKTIPMRIGQWIGEDVPLDEAIVHRTNTDAHINRRYSRGNGQECVSLYVACGIDTARLMVHRPEVCYPAAGWTLDAHHSAALPLGDGTILPCTIFQFSRGGIDGEGVTVVNYFFVQGWRWDSISPLRSRLWRILTMVDYVAQVQIVASAKPLSPDFATKLVSDFGVDSGPSIIGLFEKLKAKRQSGGFCTTPEGK